MLLDPRTLPDSSSRRPKRADVRVEPASQFDAKQDLLYGWQPSWAGAIVRWRWLFVIAWVALNALSFNGQWRVGLDSALYRHLGHNLATGEGYRIFGEIHGHVYPGLPVLLGALEAIFGNAVWPPILVMLLASAGTLWLTCLLLRRVLPEWAAILATVGVAFNFRFVQQGHELMTDAPFLLGVVLTLWGLEALRDGPRRRGVAALVGGLVLAASMRPTFWVLAGAVAFGAVCTAVRGWRASTGSAHRIHAARAIAVLAFVVLAVGAFLVFDPRIRGMDLASGGYERELLDRLTNIGPLVAALPAKLLSILNDDLPRLFFAERVSYLHIVFALALLGGVSLLALGGWRERATPASDRRPTWVALVALLFVATLLASSEPRYWLMVLPVLWVGWIIGLCKGARDWFSTTRARSIYVALGVAAVLVGNLAHAGKFVAEQRAAPFLEHYKEGQYVPVKELARALNAGTTRDQTIIGPYAPLLSYWADRRIIDRRRLGFGHISDRRDRLVAVRDAEADWMVFPWQPYEHKDAELRRLVKAGDVYPANLRPEDAINVGVFGEGDDAVEWYVAPYEIDELLLPESMRKRLKGLDPEAAKAEQEAQRAAQQRAQPGGAR